MAVEIKGKIVLNNDVRFNKQKKISRNKIIILYILYYLKIF